MNRLWIASLAVIVAAGSASAQQAPAPAAAAPATPPSLTGGMKQSWEGIKRNVTEAAEKMPEASYSFKATPDVRSFGELVGHVAAAQSSYCGLTKGETVPPAAKDYEKLTTKAALMKALQDSNAVCDSAFAAFTDESVLKPVKFGPREVIPVNTLWGNISHSNEHYGNMVTYLRLKGMVPPSTERAQPPARRPAND